ncbi:MAG TPA: DUF72 domain-containing protein [Terriglobales bacterium]|nr:DUF72 domain-containing protein [Terriglobales bacterium]
MAQLFAGTSGWAYPSWKPDFYPQKLAQAKFLSHYATQLNAVEVNFTFRQLVKETTLAKWMADSPEGFRFTIKAHQVITHIKRLKGTEDFVPRFLATIEPLASAGKLGPVLFQLPPNLKLDVEVLRTFLATLPKPLQKAFEFRHASWFGDETYSVLKENRVALCIAETEEMTTPEVVTGDFVYYRFRKPNYLPDERAAMISRIEQHLGAGRDVFAYFKHEETPEGAIYARELLESFPR